MEIFKREKEPANQAGKKQEVTAEGWEEPTGEGTILREKLLQLDWMLE